MLFILLITEIKFIIKGKNNSKSKSPSNMG